MNTENIINSNEIDQNEIESDSLAAMLTGEERAERGLINSLEARRTNVRTASGECWLSATEGECPPLGSNVPFERFYEQAITSQGKSPLSPAAQRNESKKVTKSSTPLPILRPPRISNRSATTGGHVSMVRGNPEKRVNAMDTRLRFQQAVQAVRSNSRLANEDNIPLNTVTNRRHHRRSTSRAQIFLDSIQNDDENMPEEAVRSVSSTNMSSDNALPPNEETQGQSYKQHRRGISLTMTESAQFLVDNLVVLADDTTHQFQGRTKEAGHLQDIARKTTESSDDSRDLFPVISTSTLTDVELGGENIPLLSTGDNSQRENFNETAPQKKNESYCDDARSNKGHERKASEATLTAASIYRRKRQNKQTKLQKIKDSFIQCCNPLSLFTMFYRRFQKSYFLLAALPLCVTSLILFYFLGNPRFYFLPGAATLAWWLNFFGKECILLELARYIQWLVIDYGVLRTQFGVKCLGPFVTLLCIQSKGWPFIAMTWSTLDLFLLHGNDHFQQHWLYFTNIRFYHEANSGSYVLVSELYLRLLLSMMLVGFATTLKRSTVAVAFGRRTFCKSDDFIW